MRLTPPAIGLLRELSPEVPPEVRARLVLGEPPEALRPHSHPVAVLLRDHWKRRVCDRRDIAHQLGGGSNPAKTLRRIDQILNGERLLPEWINRLATHLEIPEADITATWAATKVWQENLESFHRHRRRHQTYARFGPYLRPLPPAGAKPVNATVPHDQRIADLLEVHGDPAPAELTPWLKSHANHLIEGQFPIAGWVYLRAPEALHYFTREGQILQSDNAGLPIPPHIADPAIDLWRNQP